MSRRRKNKKRNPNAKISRYGPCDICRKTTIIYEHHFLKEVVFGKNQEIGFVCESCHHHIDMSVKLFEEVILDKFGQCNIKIWNAYLHKGGISERVIKQNTRKRFRELANEEIFQNKNKPDAREGKAGYYSLNNKQLVEVHSKKCKICGKKAMPTIHHIKKWIVFKDNSLLGFPCRKCHNAIEASVKIHEKEVLKFFRNSYYLIWDICCENGFISSRRVKKLAKNQLLQTRNKFFEKRYGEKTIVKNYGKEKNGQISRILRESGRIPV
jgi:hypothetical protein